MRNIFMEYKYATVLGATAIVSAGLGVVAGYSLALRRTRQIRKQCDKVLQEAHKMYMAVRTEKAKSDLQKIQDIKEVLVSYQGETEPVHIQEEPKIEPIVPRLISREEFDENQCAFARRTVQFYSDDVWTYKTGEIISDIYELLGDALTEANSDLDAEDYVMNEERKTLYKVLHMNDFYSDDAFHAAHSPNGKSVLGFNMPMELKRRDASRPYVIAAEELGEEGFDCTTLDYYAGDDILADESEQPIPDVDRIVGVENLSKFGYGSHDKSLVYVRNEAMGSDFEICLNPGKYEDFVLGEELKHSYEPKIRRFRDYAE